MCMSRSIPNLLTYMTLREIGLLFSSNNSDDAEILITDIGITSCTSQCQPTKLY